MKVDAKFQGNSLILCNFWPVFTGTFSCLYVYVSTEFCLFVCMSHHFGVLYETIV